MSTKENTGSKPHTEPLHDVQSFSMIRLREVWLTPLLAGSICPMGIYIYVLWFL